MAKRLTKRIRTGDLESQGEGTWIEVRRTLKGKHYLMLLDLATLGDTDWTAAPPLEVRRALEGIFQTLSELIVAWNWHDEEGQPLPPPDAPEVIAELSIAEIYWLANKLGEMAGEVERQAVPLETSNT